MCVGCEVHVNNINRGTEEELKLQYNQTGACREVRKRLSVTFRVFGTDDDPLPHPPGICETTQNKHCLFFFFIIIIGVLLLL